MTRKEAKAIGGKLYRQWLEGYGYVRNYSNAAFDRKHCLECLEADLKFANNITYFMEARAFAYGMAAEMRNRLKKGNYIR